MKRSGLLINLIIAIIAAAVIVVLLTASAYIGDQEHPSPHLSGDLLEVRFLDVGQGDAALLICGGNTMMIDGGNVSDSSFIYSYLKKSGIGHLDYVVCTHPHEDHAGGLAGALNACEADVILSPVENSDNEAFLSLLKQIEKQNLAITVPAVGDEFYLGTAKITVIGPMRQHEEVNNDSLVLKIEFGRTSFLFTGDAEREEESEVTDEYDDLKSTVLKVAHHGSASSSSYAVLRAVMPEYAVISVGDGNPYAHPHNDVMSRLRDVGAKVYRTDMQGTVTAVSDGRSVEFRVERNKDAVTNPTEEYADGSAYYIGNKKTLTFHLPDCPSLPVPGNQVIFDSRSDAIKRGFTPCGMCRP